MCTLTRNVIQDYHQQHTTTETPLSAQTNCLFSMTTVMERHATSCNFRLFVSHAAIRSFLHYHVWCLKQSMHTCAHVYRLLYHFNALPQHEHTLNDLMNS